MNSGSLEVQFSHEAVKGTPLPEQVCDTFGVQMAAGVPLSLS
jgi:hypothetical protein